MFVMVMIVNNMLSAYKIKAEINRLDQYTCKVNHNEEVTGVVKEYEGF